MSISGKEIFPSIPFLPSHCQKGIQVGPRQLDRIGPGLRSHRLKRFSFRYTCPTSARVMPSFRFLSVLARLSFASLSLTLRKKISTLSLSTLIEMKAQKIPDQVFLLTVFFFPSKFQSESLDPTPISWFSSGFNQIWNPILKISEGLGFHTSTNFDLGHSLSHLIAIAIEDLIFQKN